MAKRKNQRSKPQAQKGKPSTIKSTPPNIRKTEAAPTEFIDKKALRWLLWGGALVTLVMWLSLNDPFNAPKSWFLSITSFWLFGWLIFNFKHFVKDKVLKQTSLIAVIFFVTLFLAWIATDNKFVGFFGQYGRKTGLLEYFGLLTFFIASAYLIRLNQTSKLERTVVFLGSVLGIYGFFQHYKIDFIKWHYLYNSVLGTLGNPDFAGAIMAILLVLNFGVAIEAKHEKWFRSVAGFNALLLAIVIVFSQARQGLLAAGIGIAFIALVWIYQRNKRASLMLAGLSLFGGLAVIAGMLKVGPLTRLFYKDSVTFRGDYWRAAVRMFVHHPFFGVGIDRYGTNFRQYRDTTQVLRRGPSVVADAAHDVPLQLASTGGILVLLAFLLFTAFTLLRGVVALRNSEGAKQILVAVIFGAWITYQAQSLISIDNLGIAIWGYILSGAVIGISITPETSPVPRREASQAQPFISALLALVMVVVSFLFFQAEGAFHTLSAIVPTKDAKVLQEYESFVKKPLSYVFQEPTFVLTAAQDYEKAGDTAKAIATYKGLIAKDSKNLDALTGLSAIYSSQKSWSQAITLDKSIVKLDPFNTSALLQLGRDEKASGDFTSAKAVIPLINAIAPSGADAKQAQTEFGK